MPKLNENYLNLKESYLFTEIAHRVNAYTAANPDKKVIRLGIGDVTLPIGSEVIAQLHEGVDALSKAETFKGYGPEQGYDFLRNAIVDYYKRNGVSIEADEVFVSDGAKSDTGNITDLFAKDNVIMIPDPVYPVYVDTNIMNGRSITYIDANAENNFLPMPDRTKHADIIYICSPNNPTGAAYNKEQLKEWVDYALENDAIILYDSAYECFITDETLPRSIFAIEGSKKCAIEFCSLSKTAGFTGTRGVEVHGIKRRRNVAQFYVEPPPDNKIQRRFIYRAEGRSRRLLRRGNGAMQGKHKILSGKCPHNRRSVCKKGNPLFRRHKLTLHLV